MASGAGIVFIGMFISKVLTYAWRIVVARVGTEEYGLLSLGLAVLGIATTISMLGLASGVLRYVSYYSGKNDEARMKGVITTALKITVPLSLLLAAVTYLLAETIAIQLFHNARLVPVIKIIAFAIPLNVTANIFLAALRAFQKIKYEVITKQLIEGIVRLAATITAVYLSWGLFGITIAYVTAIGSIAIFSFYFLEKHVFPIIKTKIKSISTQKELLSYSLPLVLSSIIGLILSWTDTIMLGAYKTAEIVGLYNAALPTASLMLLFPTAILSLFLPVITRDYANNRIENIKKTYASTTKWIFIANFPALLIMVFFSQNIISLLFGGNYATAAPALSILAVGYFITSLANASGAILDMHKKTKLILKISVLTAVGNVLLNSLLIPPYGMIGGAIATSFSLVFGAILVTYHARKNINVSAYNLTMLKIVIVGSVMMYALYFGLHQFYNTIPTFPAIVGTIILAIIYLLAIIRLKIVQKEEKEIINLYTKAMNQIKKIKTKS